jgi:hypothetical protein
MATVDKRITAPALPTPPVEYKKGGFDQLNNVLRIYFNRVDHIIQTLIRTNDVSVKNYEAKTGDYTVLDTDFLIHYASGSYTVTMLSAALVEAGQEFEIKNSGTGIITVATTSSQTIDGDLTKLLVQYDAMKIMSDGANWIIV